jgi:hypothetical protein
VENIALIPNFAMESNRDTFQLKEAEDLVVVKPILLFVGLEVRFEL